MDEREILVRLADIRRLAVGSPLAIKAIDALMEQMTFGDWPHGDALMERMMPPEPPRTREFFL